MDFSKAFDSIDQNITWAAINSYGVDKKLTRFLREINGNATAAVRIQGDPILPNTFILVLERILDKIRDKEGGVKISGTRINNLICR